MTVLTLDNTAVDLLLNKHIVLFLATCVCHTPFLHISTEQELQREEVREVKRV
jgi:hypothetical protein